MPKKNSRSKKRSRGSRSRQRKSPIKSPKNSPRKSPRKSRSGNYHNYYVEQPLQAYEQQDIIVPPSAEYEYSDMPRKTSNSAKTLGTIALTASALILVKYLRDHNKALQEELEAIKKFVNKNTGTDATEFQNFINSNAKKLIAVAGIAGAAGGLNWYYPGSSVFFTDLLNAAMGNLPSDIKNFVDKVIGLQSKLKEKTPWEKFVNKIPYFGK